jgi:hypothetical protein
MILAQFLKLAVASKTVRQAVRRHLQQKLSKARMGQPTPTNESIIFISNKPSLLDLTGS